MDFPKWGWWGLCTRNQDKELLRFLCQCTSANIRPRSKHFGQKMFFLVNVKKKGSIHSDEYRTIKKKQNLQNILKKCLHWTNVAFQSFANPPRLTVIGNIRILFSDHFPGPLACTPTDLVSKKKAAVQFSLFSALAAFFWPGCQRPPVDKRETQRAAKIGVHAAGQKSSLFRLVLELKQKYVLPSIHLRLIFRNWKSTDFNNLTIYSIYMADVWNMKASIILFWLLHSIFCSAFCFFMFAFWLSWLGLITMIRKYYLKS